MPEQWCSIGGGLQARLPRSILRDDPSPAYPTPLIVTQEVSPAVDVAPAAEDSSSPLVLPGAPYAAGVGFSVSTVATFRPASAPGFFRVRTVVQYSLDGAGSWLDAGAGSDVGYDMSFALLGTAYQIAYAWIVDAGAIAVPLQVRTLFQVHGSSVGDVRWQRVQTLCTQGVVSVI